MTDLASDIWAELRDVPETYRTKEKGLSDIVVLYEQSRLLWNENYYSLPASQRREFIQTDDPVSIQVGAHLVLWGKLKATGWAAGNPKTIAMIEQLMGQYNIPLDAVPSMKEPEEEGEYPWQQQPTEAGETPWQGETEKEKYPWRK
jgi:hypothetical protein